MNYKNNLEKKTMLTTAVLLTVILSLTIVGIFTSAANALTISSTQSTVCSGSTCTTTTCNNNSPCTTTTGSSGNNFAFNLCTFLGCTTTNSP